MSHKQVEIKLTIDNPYKIATFILLAGLIALIVLQTGLPLIDIIKEEPVVTYQACVWPEDCAAGWGCQRADPHSLVGKCVDIVMD